MTQADVRRTTKPRGKVRTWFDEGRPIVSRWSHTKDGMDLTWVGHAANHYHRITRWVRWGWWSYVLEKPEHRGARYWTVVWCRLRGHPAGIVYYNFAPDAIEPDYSCKNCGEVIW